MNTLIKSVGCLLLSVTSYVCSAQKKPVNFLLGQYDAQTPGTSYLISGFGSNYSTSSNYNLSFGARNASTRGFNRVVKLFEIDEESYSVTKAVPGQKPFGKVIVKRSTPTVKTTALFEMANTPSGNPVPNNANVYLTPDYIGTMEDLINSYVINRGTDNVFINSGTTSNNIERVDMIMEETVPVNSVNRTTSGFLLMERGGNDVFKVAAITGLSGDNVTTLTTPVLVEKSKWGATGVSFTSLVMQRVVGTDNNLKPSQNIASQSISGVFISLSDLGLPANSTLYGISIFAGDVNLTGNPLVNISNYPTNTAETNDYGLDFMAGGGFFTKALLIKGTVWKDENQNAITDPSETPVPTGSWANLVDPQDNVVSSVKVTENGDYTLFIADNNISAGNYKVVLTNSEHFEGEKLTQAETPDGYGYTGVNVGGTANTSNKTGIINIGEIQDNDIEHIDFGILDEDLLPVTFGNINAYVKGNELFVYWSTLTETGNAKFEIEASHDGKNFTKIGEVITSADNGDSSTAIEYSFQKSIAPGLLFIPACALIGLLLIFFNRRNKLWVMSLTFVMISSCLFYSCTKGDPTSIADIDKLYIRIKQIDRDHQYEYSKVVQVIKD
ncbi:MAG TPA: hypothetical protein PKE30_08730 [Niabella sp.]|nr:hypothetical protein [Niabella sp.]